ncbi:MAG: glycosyltransferase family 39 protein [Verrucomicrobia bacterium]|nr:glycosyltransferase family 39 protein [Verrucomicrobiota bacterium]
MDEIVLMNTMNLRFLEGCNASSAYWPAHLLIRCFFFLETFQHYRFISVCFGSATVLVVYALARRLVAQPLAWGFSALFSFQWYFLYMSRIIEIASFIPLFTALCLWAIVRWQETRRPAFAILFFGLGGIAANIWTSPMFYLAGAGTVFFLWEAVRKRLRWIWVLVCMATLVITLLPYLHVLLTTAHVRDEILLRYQMTGAVATGLLPATLAHPAVAIQTWTHLATFFHERLPWTALAPFALILLALPFVAFRWLRATPMLRMLLFLTAAQLALLALSPVPLYIEGHAGPLLLCILLLLLGLAASHALLWLRTAAGGVLVVCLLSSFGFAPYYLDNQQSRLRDWLRHNIVERSVPTLCVSDGAYLKLTKIPNIVALGIPYEIFTTAPDDRFWQTHSPANFPVIISTYECNMDEYVRKKGFILRHQFTMNNLYETHLRHGIDVWTVDNPEHSK